MRRGRKWTKHQRNEGVDRKREYLDVEGNGIKRKTGGMVLIVTVASELQWSMEERRKKASCTRIAQIRT